jgi:hypothetical protein
VRVAETRHDANARRVGPVRLQRLSPIATSIRQRPTRSHPEPGSGTAT